MWENWNGASAEITSSSAVQVRAVSLLNLLDSLIRKEVRSARRFGSIAEEKRERERKIQIAAQSCRAIRFTVILAPSKTLLQSWQPIMYPICLVGKLTPARYRCRMYQASFHPIPSSDRVIYVSFNPPLLRPTSRSLSRRNSRRTSIWVCLNPASCCLIPGRGPRDDWDWS